MLVSAGVLAGLLAGFVVRTPLLLRWAVAHRRPTLARWAVRHGGYRLEGRTGSLLYDACPIGGAELVRDLLALGADADARYDGQPALHTAVSWQRADVAKLLLAGGADANARGLGGSTPLSTAASLGRADLTRMLLNAGADARAVDSAGYTPLMNAAQFGAGLTVVRLLVEHGADVNGIHRRDEQSVLMYAVRACPPEVVTYLVRAGAATDHESSLDGTDALQAAAIQDRSDNLRALVASGVDVNRRNRNGQTALGSIATSWDREKATRTLLELGARAGSREPGDRTMADVARSAQQYDKADLLDAAERLHPTPPPVPVPRDTSHDHVPGD